MLIVIDKKIPKEAKTKLAQFGKLLELETSDITYEAISGHPDIFISQINNDVIVAPNLPQNFKDTLNKNGISFHVGEQAIGQKYPETAAYNVVSTSKFLFHNLKYSDLAVKDLAFGLDKIHVEQAYTRCNLISMNGEYFITSDKGIEKQLNELHQDVFYVDPMGILLPGFKNGFIGGCAGFFKNQLFLIGNLDFYPAGKAMRKKLNEWNIELVELYDGPLFDGGSILFLY